MNYRIMPPGSYLFWRIGMMSPLIRWALTVVLCAVLIMSWYLLTSRILFKSSAEQPWCVQCATQLAELATLPEDALSAQAGVAPELENPSLQLLQLCDQQHIAIQSCVCHKPTTKNNRTTQRVNLICTGTLTQCKALVSAVAASSIPISNVEVTLKQQHNKLYTCTLTGDCLMVG